MNQKDQGVLGVRCNPADDDCAVNNIGVEIDCQVKKIHALNMGPNRPSAIPSPKSTSRAENTCQTYHENQFSRIMVQITMYFEIVVYTASFPHGARPLKRQT